MTIDRVVLLAPRTSGTGRRLAETAAGRGLRVLTADGWALPAEAQGAERAHLYGGPLLADRVAGELDIVPLEPPADWLARLPTGLTGRRVEAVTLEEARELRRPAFVKPPTDKFFPARIYPDGSRLPGPDAFDDDLPVLVSDIVCFAREYRLFVLDGAVHTGSRYSVGATLDPAPLAEDRFDTEVRAFATELLTEAAGSLPSAAVVDVGLLDGGGWAAVETNPAWASGGYACDPERVLDVVLRAAGPAAEAAPPDLRFARSLPEVPAGQGSSGRTGARANGSPVVRT
ncbi:ATP-grasp domain-containing protein [Streptomyces sp. NPDC057565]|uniref:ATP-grasp domain-containing protein n=1 Tax=Streptomyces sp. NPDC057565 TaxID=3346169 RepID=UPI0036ADDE15